MESKIQIYRVGRLSVSASEFVPRQYESAKEEQSEDSVTILYDSMYQLTLEPGRFDSIARKLTKDQNEVIQDDETLETLAETILGNGIINLTFATQELVCVTI